jgi:CubicO group peptidase (beta-lactamase class C family)
MSISGERVSRRRALGYGGGLAATALATSSIAHSARAQDPAASPVAQGVTPDSIAAACDQIVEFTANLREQAGVPGIALCVVYRDEVVLVEGFGVREVGESNPIDGNTVFQLASVSKSLAATTVAAAIGDGAASWDSRVDDLDPAFAMSDPWITNEVTVRDFFSHRSGLPDHGGDDLEDLGYDRKEILHRLRYIQPAGSFRADYAYTNFGLTAAAVAVAKAAGSEWEELAATRLYEPLGMTSTSSRFDDYISAENRAVPHVLIDGSYVAKYQRQPDAQSPAGGVSSTVSDLAQWMRMLLGNGSLGGEAIVDPTALGETFRPHITSNAAENPSLDRTGFYGLGWNVGYDAEGDVTIGHSGGFAMGAGTTVYLRPAHEFGIAVLSNAAANGIVESIALSFIDLATTGTIAYDYFSILEPIIAEDMLPKYGRDIDYTVAPADASPAQPLDVYAGRFESDLYGIAEVAIDGNALVLHLGPDQTAYAMRHYTHDTFLYQPVGENAGGESAVSFAIAPNGSAGSVTIEILDIYHQGTFNRVGE